MLLFVVVKGILLALIGKGANGLLNEREGEGKETWDWSSSSLVLLLLSSIERLDEVLRLSLLLSLRILIFKPWFAKHWEISVDWSIPGNLLAEKTVNGFEYKDFLW